MHARASKGPSTNAPLGARAGTSRATATTDANATANATASPPAGEPATGGTTGAAGSGGGGERLLVVEDEYAMRTALMDCLGSEGYRVFVAVDGADGLVKAVEGKPDLILLDIMMPKLDGIALSAELRRLGHAVPILLLTAKGQVDDRVAGLDAGADDYLVKPFSTDELLARIRALLRRSRRGGKAVRELDLGDTRVDLVRLEASRKGRPVHFTAKEFAMLRLLAEAGGEPVTRERFLDVVWGYAAFPTTRTVDTHMASLRAKLESDPENPKWLKTVHGVGYRLWIEPAVGGAEKAV